MNIQKPRGTEDIYYEKINELNSLELILRNIAIKYNYREIRTPIFETKDLFIRSLGTETDIVSKEMFELDNKKRSFVLRPEGTAPVIRSIIENKLYVKYELPLKLFYIGNMFRYERPQRGRLRQFNQFGVEVIGAKNYLLDVEVILLGFNLLKNIGLIDLTLKLNYLTVGTMRSNYLVLLTSFFKKKTSLCVDCQIRIQNNPLRILDCKIDHDKFFNAPKIYDYLTTAESKEFILIQNLLNELKIPFTLDPQLVRGLDYYTGVVFEIVTNNIQKQSLVLLGGGRYDRLINTFEPNLDYPAVGFALGLERLLLTLSEYNIVLSNKEHSYLDVYLICLSDRARYFAVSLLLLLRTNNFKSNCDYLARSIKTQFKSLERSKAKNAIIIGDKELDKNIVKIKNQQTGKEQEVNFENIITFLNKEKK